MKNKNCPFCDHEIFDVIRGNDCLYLAKYSIQCLNCGCQGPVLYESKNIDYENIKKNCLKSWNIRVENDL